MPVMSVRVKNNALLLGKRELLTVCHQVFVTFPSGTILISNFSTILKSAHWGLKLLKYLIAEGNLWKKEDLNDCGYAAGSTIRCKNDSRCIRL
jgi:hypothetical protein